MWNYKKVPWKYYKSSYSLRSIFQNLWSCAIDLWNRRNKNLSSFVNLIICPGSWTGFSDSFMSHTDPVLEFLKYRLETWNIYHKSYRPLLWCFLCNFIVWQLSFIFIIWKTMAMIFLKDFNNKVSHRSLEQHKGDDRIFIFEWTVPFKWLLNERFHKINELL